MASSRSAFDILARPDDFDLGNPSIVVLVGDEPFLEFHTLSLLRERLCPDEADRAWAWREFSGDEPPDPRDVFDEAATVPMFTGATRAAVVRNADAFVTEARAALEKIAGGPRGRRGLVILQVRSLPANTRLAKAATANGLVVDVNVPERADLAGWVRRWARSRHGITVAEPTAERLLERLGGDLGQVDQALARLAAARGPGGPAATIQPDAIEDIVGSPQERTAWKMIDAAAAGETDAAIAQLADLLDTGESPIGIAAQAATVLRRLSTAARLLAMPADAGRPTGVEAALKAAGVASWPKAIAEARSALMQLGSRRARRLPLWLLELDRALKGDASRGLRARLALERLFCKMSTQAGHGRPATDHPRGAAP